MPSDLPRLTTSIALPRCVGTQKSAHSDSAAVNAPVVPIPVSMRATNSTGTPCAKPVSTVPSVHTSASAIIIRTRL